jgi:hypothetical protein
MHCLLHCPDKFFDFVDFLDLQLFVIGEKIVFTWQLLFIVWFKFLGNYSPSLPLPWMISCPLYLGFVEGKKGCPAFT